MMNSQLRRLILFLLLTVGSAASSGAQRMGFTLDSLRVGDRVRFVSRDFLPASERRGTLKFVSSDSLLVRSAPIRSRGNDPEIWTIRRVTIVSLDISRRREVSSARTVIGAVLGVPLGFLGGWGACRLVFQINSSACNLDHNYRGWVRRHPPVRLHGGRRPRHGRADQPNAASYRPSSRKRGRLRHARCWLAREG